ncbi:FISUMP domain-containing protein [uncultured Fibrobacter sp.]|uniref:FISUMP domain-containing protein n=1 Tax=uncultured Fibrobacter sp. TaxID=261512 RepID=UPI0025E26174|nr:FISUMP domain-containing protein [uncultured Fibrobacter sp.]
MKNAFAKVAVSISVSALLSLTACGDSTSAIDDVSDEVSSSSEIDEPDSSDESFSSSSSQKGSSSSSEKKESSSSSKTSSSASESSSSSADAEKPKSSSSVEKAPESSSDTATTTTSSSSEQSSSSSAESSSSAVVVTPATTFTDSRDGKTYKLAKIGTQTWMAENLNYGDSSLYSFDQAQSACPTGFHLPSLREFHALVDFVGGADVAAQKLKSTTGWPNDANGNWNGTDDYGFGAKPIVSGDGAGTDENFWSSTINTRNHYSGDFLKLDPHPASDSNADYHAFCRDRDDASPTRACFVNGERTTKLSIRCLSNSEECGGTIIDNTKQFCQNGVAYDICRQRQYDATKYECRNDTLYEKSSGNVFKYSWFLLNPTKTYGTFRDSRDGQYYKTIDIDGVVWFAENLNYASPGSLCPENDDTYCDVYGRMYTHKEAMQNDSMSLQNVQGICPDGTHLAEYREYASLWEKFEFEQLYTAYTAYFENDDYDGELSRLKNESGLSMLENGAYNRGDKDWANINRTTRNIGQDFKHFHYYRWSGSGIQDFYGMAIYDDREFGAVRCIVD